MDGGRASEGNPRMNCVADDRHRRPLADRGSPGRTHGNAVTNPRIRVCSTVLLTALPPATMPLPVSLAELFHLVRTEVKGADLTSWHSLLANSDVGISGPPPSQQKASR